MKKWTLAEFYAKVEQGKCTLAIRCAIGGIVFGVAYIFVGIFWHGIIVAPFLAQRAELIVVVQAVAIIAFLVGYPAFLYILDVVFRWFWRWPVCPACARKLRSPDSVLCTHYCYHCGAEIVEDMLSEHSAQYMQAKEKLEEKTNLPITWGVGLKMIAFTLGCIVIVFVPLLGGIWGLSALAEKWEFEAMATLVMIGYGTMIIIISTGVLRSGTAISRILGRWLELPDGKMNGDFCPDCGRRPEQRILKFTGRCNHCGVTLIPGTKQEGAQLMEWENVRKFNRVSRFWEAPFGVVLIWALLYLRRADLIWYLLGAFAVGFVLWFTVLKPYLKRKYGIFRRCPYCNTRIMGEYYWRIQTFRRCPECYRQLVKSKE